MNTRKMVLFGGVVLTMGIGLIFAGCCRTNAKADPIPSTTEAAATSTAAAKSGEEPCSIVLAVTGMS